MRILVVDDAHVERAVLRSMLEQEHFEVVGEASTGVQAVELFRSLRPDVALVDLLLPQMSGIEVARAILTLHPNASLIAVSGLSQGSVKAEAARVGMRGFLVKPVERTVLYREIRQAAPNGQT
ncbi:MAG: response regulator [Myxococcota bacterium]